jgi:DNA (cytosine-5)-methyltransferase 1
LKELGIPNFDFPKPSFNKVYLRDFLEKNVDTTDFEINRKDIKITKPLIQKPSLRPIQIGVINKGGQGERIYSIEGHAITFSAYGGGAAAKTGAYLIDGKIRKLTPREVARIMGFPEKFQIPKNPPQAYTQLGNSVVVPVLKKITEQILQTCKIEGEKCAQQI